MKNWVKFLPVFLTICLSFPAVSLAKSGCCSGHGGVNCAAGVQANGHVVCNDGWRGSSCLYSEMVMCGGLFSTQVTVPTHILAPTVSVNTTVPTRIPANIFTLTPTNLPRATDISKSNLSTQPSGSSDGLGGIVVLVGIAYAGYRLIRKQRKKDE